MQPKVINCVLNSPIERMRGGDIVVSVTTTLEDNGKQYSISGFTTISENAEIGNGFKLAFQNSLANFENLIKPFNSTKVIKVLLKDQINKIAEEAIAKNPNVKEALESPANQNKQNAINLVCEILGFPSINVMENYTMVEAQALLTALESQAKPLEAKE